MVGICVVQGPPPPPPLYETQILIDVTMKWQLDLKKYWMVVFEIRSHDSIHGENKNIESSELPTLVILLSV